MLISVGLFSQGFRQKYFSYLKEFSGEKNIFSVRSMLLILILWGLIVTFAVIFFTPLSGEGFYINRVHFFILILVFSFGYILLSVSYADHWRLGRLYVSYLIDSLFNICLLFSIFLGLYVGFSIWFWMAAFLLVAVIFGLVFFRNNSLFFDKDLAYAAMTSQVVVFISYFEVFFIANMDSSGVVYYRYIIITSFLLVTLLNMIKQQYLVSNTPSINLGFLFVVFILSIFMSFFSFFGSVVFGIEVNIYIVAFIFLFGCILQVFLSILNFDFFRSKSSAFLFLSNIMTAITLALYIFIFSGFERIGVYDLLLIKSGAIWIGVFYLLLFYFFYAKKRVKAKV
ncbi:hypothetical protein [Saccharospirillum sp. MSK14-1]|uniref:hypothetical protein n=1 Tax=Saccharospirillum sp. MSK14-1 TaxID=1897632 RepID=UPI0011B299EC|nr:hypothetical protein [Saccharospirillum sp. MSK14-1]